MLEANSSKPIYIQIADWLENEILEGTLAAHDKVHSQYQLAEIFNVNPATAGKGITLLLEKEIVYKKRGLGTFVSEEGRQKLRTERTEERLQHKIDALLEEAKRLKIDYQALLQLIEKAYAAQGGEEN